MIEFLSQHGLPALFVLSFLAATVIPLGAEWLVVLLLTQNHSPPAVVAVATAGNFLGACTTYYLGYLGAQWLIRRFFGISDASAERAGDLYRKWGEWTLLLSWLPVVGDPLCLAAGVFKTSLLTFSLLVLTGKLLRYTFVAWLTVSALAR